MIREDGSKGECERGAREKSLDGWKNGGLDGWKDKNRKDVKRISDSGLLILKIRRKADTRSETVEAIQKIDGDYAKVEGTKIELLFCS